MRQAAHVFYLQNSVHKSAYPWHFLPCRLYQEIRLPERVHFLNHTKNEYIHMPLCTSAGCSVLLHGKWLSFPLLQFLPHRPANPLTGSQTMLSYRYHPGPDTPFLLQMYNQYQKVLLFFYYRIFSDDESVTYHFSNPASFFTVWHMYFIILHIYGICKLVFINL